MVENRLDKKYYNLIWIFAFVAALASNVYSMYLTFIDFGELDAASIVLNVIVTLFSSGLVPMLIYYLVASIVYSFGFKRFARAISRNDFIYTTMIFTSTVKLICGLISAFGILAPIANAVSSELVEPVLLFAAYLIMFFVIFVKQYNLNPAEKLECFKSWSTIYFVLYGIVTLLTFGAIFLYGALETVAEELGYMIIISPVEKWFAIAAVGIYIIALIIDIIICEKFKKEAAEYSGPSTREIYMKKREEFLRRQGFNGGFGTDTMNVFGMDESDKSDNKDDDDHHNDGGSVFEEFDL